MKVSDYIIKFFQHKKIKHITLNNGGAISFLADEIFKSKKFKILTPVHEQSSAFINDSISRISKIPSVSLVTSGPGATNLVTGITASWLDSVPSIFITGQVNSFEMKKKNEKVRQVGFQETNIIDICKTITKSVFHISKPEDILTLLPKAYDNCITARYGPVIIDIPLDFQRAEIKICKSSFFSKPSKSDIKKKKYKTRNNKLIKLNNLILKSKRPVLLIGHGVRLSQSVILAKKLNKSLKFPVLTTWGGKDCFNNYDKNYFGSIGVYGNRFSNIILQNCDLLICLGTRLDTRVTGGKYLNFCKKAKIISVDIDDHELRKIRRPKSYLKFNMDVKLFINSFSKNLNNKNKFLKWKKFCNQISNLFQENDQKSKLVKPEIFFQKLNLFNEKIDYYFADTGAHLCWAAQNLKINKNQRFITSFGHSTMGYALPAAIGANFFNPSSCSVSINGDCSFQLNIQELALSQKINANIKFFIINNNGYGIIRQFQDNYLNSRYFGTCEYIGKINLKNICKGFSVDYHSIKKNNEINKTLTKIFSSKKTSVTEVFINQNHKIFPKIEYGNNLDNMSPSLDQKYIKLIEYFKSTLLKS